MEKLDLRIRRSDSVGIMHDSRQDARTLMKCINTVVEKLNEVIDKINELEKAK